MWSQLADDLFLWRDCCNVYAIRRSDEAVLVDSGTGAVADHLEAIGVRRVAHVLHTHHHRDQCQGSLRLHAAGTALWAPANFADVLEHPHAYKTQCLWYEPIPVDRVLPLSETVFWRGIALTPYAQPGHTRYAACIAFSVDGKRCLAIGDQFVHNYVYANQFALGDYPATVELWRRLAPDRILPGHGPAEDGPAAIARFAAHAQETDDLHARLLPLHEVDLGAGGQAAELYPYHAFPAPGGTVHLRVTARNPLPRDAETRVRLALPNGWRAEPGEAAIAVAARGTGTVTFRLTVGGKAARRARYAVELTVDGRPFGQVEEGFVTVQE